MWYFAAGMLSGILLSGAAVYGLLLKRFLMFDDPLNLPNIPPEWAHRK